MTPSLAAILEVWHRSDLAEDRRHPRTPSAMRRIRRERRTRDARLLGDVPTVKAKRTRA